ncbi:DUF6919 domain-containing protein [Streptomyces sp. NPDC001920]
MPVLALANRAGYLTDNSQPGLAATGSDGRWRAQRAAVTGWVRRDRASVDLVNQILAPAEAAGLIVCADSHRDGVTVTSVDGRDYTTFGARLSKRDLRTRWPAHLIHRDLFRQLQGAISSHSSTPSTAAAICCGTSWPRPSTRRPPGPPHRPSPNPACTCWSARPDAASPPSPTATPAAVTAFDAILTARLERGLLTVLDATHAEACHRGKYTPTSPTSTACQPSPCCRTPTHASASAASRCARTRRVCPRASCAARPAKRPASTPRRTASTPCSARPPHRPQLTTPQPPPRRKEPAVQTTPAPQPQTDAGPSTRRTDHRP